MLRKSKTPVLDNLMARIKELREAQAAARAEIEAQREALAEAETELDVTFARPAQLGIAR